MGQVWVDVTSKLLMKILTWVAFSKNLLLILKQASKIQRKFGLEVVILSFVIQYNYLYCYSQENEAVKKKRQSKHISK